jgi:hypothetical protein
VLSKAAMTVARQPLFPSARSVFAALMLAAMAVIHVVALPVHAAEAAYIGVLFALDAACAVLAAAGVAAGSAAGWRLGAAISAASLCGYVLARTAGLPDFHESDWFDFLGPLPIGLMAVVAEALFLVVYGAEELAKRGATGRL